MANVYVPPTNYKPKIDLNSGIQAGVGALDLLASNIAMGNESLNLGQAPGEQLSATGEPVYNLGDFYNRSANAKPQGATGMEVAGGVAKGASAGAAFGIPGAVIGGLVGGLGSLLGGRRRRRKQAEEKRKAMRQAASAQNNYNEASLNFDQEQIAQTEYTRRRNMTNRLYNLYNTPQTIGY